MCTYSTGGTLLSQPNAYTHAHTNTETHTYAYVLTDCANVIEDPKILSALLDFVSFFFSIKLSMNFEHDFQSIQYFFPSNFCPLFLFMVKYICLNSTTEYWLFYERHRELSASALERQLLTWLWGCTFFILLNWNRLLSSHTKALIHLSLHASLKSELNMLLNANWFELKELKYL